MLEHSILESDGVVVLTPVSSTMDEEITDIRASVDAYLGNHAAIHGVLIADWEGLAGMLGHLRFVRDYHKKIERVTFLTEVHLPAGADALAKHFVGATIKHFLPADYEEAMSWLKSG